MALSPVNYWIGMRHLAFRLDMMHTESRVVSGSPMAIAILFGILLYICSYAVLLRPDEIECPGRWGVLYQRIPAYRIENPMLTRLFVPLSATDRLLRPSYWKCRLVLGGRSGAGAGSGLDLGLKTRDK